MRILACAIPEALPSRQILVSEPHYDKLCRIAAGLGGSVTFDDVINHLIMVHDESCVQ